VIGGRPDSEAHTNYALFARTERGRGGRFLLLDCSWCSSALSADSGLLQPEFDQHPYLVELSPSKALLQYSAPLCAKFTMQNASTPVRATVPMLRRFPVHPGARTGLARTIRIDAEREYVDDCLRDHHPLDALKAQKIGHSVKQEVLRDGYIGHLE
jgi:hypothetical protein